jgi:Thioredoxin-like
MNFWKVFLCLTIVAACAQGFTQESSQPFAPLESWKNAVLSGDSATLWDLYSTQPPAEFHTAEGALPATKEIEFWQSRKSAGLSQLKVEIAKDETPEGLRQLVFEAQMRVNSPAGPRTSYVIVAQVWQKQGSTWRIVATTRGDVSRLKRPLREDPNLYLAGADAKAEIKQALARAAKGQKRLLVVFGASWCYDCYVLDSAFHSADIQPLLDANFEVVHVDIGRGEKNTDLGTKYKIPFDKGIPAIAVVASDGKLLHSQQAGEFQSARTLTAEEFEAFLNEWKPARAAR